MAPHAAQQIEAHGRLEEILRRESQDEALDFVETWDLQDVELAFGFNGASTVTQVPLEKIALRYSEK